MIRIIIINFLLFFSLIFLLPACSKIRESAGVTRKTIDEFQVVENPPLVIPPDFSLVPPNQLQQKNIDNIENELAQEILFGLNNESINNKKQLSTMNQILLNAEATNVDDNIREEVDQNFYETKKTDTIFEMKWKNEIEVLDAVEESNRIRNNVFNNDSLTKGEVPIKKEKEVIKKKKRFFFF